MKDEVSASVIPRSMLRDEESLARSARCSLAED